MKFNNKDIVIDPNEILRTKCEEVKFPLTKEDREIMMGLHDYVKYSTDEKKAKKYDLWPAVGIAAPQVGILKQMCVVYIIDEDNEPIADLKMINPEIIKESKEIIYIEDGEGCLSIKDEHEGYVPRKNKVTVKYYDINGKEKIVEAEGFIARVIQHEVDHLDGILFIDRMTPAQKLKIKKQLKKLTSQKKV